MSWYSYKNAIVFPEYAKINQFISQINLDDPNKKWHPGAIEIQNDGRWEFKQSWADDMDKVSKKADLMYLRSADGNYAIGVITNKTWNIYGTTEFDPAENNPCKSLREQWDNESDPNYTPNEPPIPSPFGQQSIQALSQGLKLNGMSSGRFYFEYYNANNPTELISTSDNNSVDKKLEFNIGMSNYDYIILFKARRRNSSWLVVSEDPSLATSIDFLDKTMPNDSLENQILVDELNIYPIPSSNKIIIEAANFEEISTIEIQNGNGLQIDTFSIFANQIEYNLEALAKGVYFIKINFKSGKGQIKKIIKI